MDLEKMGKYITEKRKNKNYTQQQLAEFLNVSSKTVSKWERGVNAPDISLLPLLAKHLDTTIENLVYANDLQKDKYQRNTISFDSAIYYVKKHKKRIRLGMIAILIFIVGFFMTIFLYEKYKSFSIYNIETNNSDFNLSGYLVYNNNTKILILNNLTYNDIYIGTDKELSLDEIKISILLGGNVLYSKSYNNNKDNSITDLLKTINLDIDEKDVKYLNKINDNNFKNLKIQIEYNDVMNEKHIESIDLLFR